MNGIVLVESDSLIHVGEGCIQIIPLKGDGTPAVSYPPEDMGVLMVEGIHSRISAYALAMLAEAKVVVCVCDARKIPVCIAAPVSAHTRHERILQRQIAYRHAGRTWKEIVAAKIFNQSEHMRRAGCGDWAGVRDLSRKVRNGDVGNLEAVAAARYFGSLGIVRTTQRDDMNPMPNPALNYAYAFVRSATARSLVAHGMQCALGMHHNNMRNPYCLADDMMEPFRILVDRIVVERQPTAFEKEDKRALWNVLNISVQINGTRQTVLNAMRIYARSVIEALNDRRPERILFYKDI